ncbi:MAG: tetratricopeptide repeat protein [Candidatus Marithrix sp.]|nr:tetratricopeptide repeat protein [Candidatus Marithrix sp.]
MQKTLKISRKLEQARKYQKTGNLQKAEVLYYQVLQQLPTHKQALNFYKKLGATFSKNGQINQAIKYYQRVLELSPNNAEIQNDLGIILGSQLKLESAKSCFQKAIAVKDNFAQAYYNLGIVFNEQKQFVEAINCFQEALSINPNHADAYLNLGNALTAQDKFTEAVNYYQKAITLDSNNVNAYNALGVALKKMDKMDESLVAFQQAIVLNPNYIAAYRNMGKILLDDYKFGKAELCFQQALKLQPNSFDAHVKLGDLLKRKSMLNAAIKHYKRALEIKPNAITSGIFVNTLNYSPDYEQATIFLEHQKFNEQYTAHLSTFVKSHTNEKNPNRQLKIGYVSADLRRHSVTFFMQQILANHDHTNFEITCYHNSKQTDEFTKQLQKYTDNWVDCVELSDEELTDKIRLDKIDILVDLSGHTAGNRLLVFARKPAPIQATYLGYPNTTGLTAIDYLITDSYVDVGEILSSEISVRMPDSFYCYDPIVECPTINELPAINNEYVTFCSFNNYIKLNPKTFILWAKILKSVPNSKLIIMTSSLQDDDVQHSLNNIFLELNIEPSQIIIGHANSTEEILELYNNRADIALDSFPYNGATTTCESLWMGVPVVTLVGETIASRVGLSILSTIGLTELIAYTPEEYVDICVNLANDTEHLQKLRREMRERMLASPLMDGVGFTKNLEIEYKKMWEKWCN